MTRTLNIHAGVMLLLSTALTYLMLSIHTPNVSEAYSLGEIMGQAIAATLLPLLLVAIPAGIFKYTKKRSLPGFYIWFWLLWIIFSVISGLGNLAQL